MPVYCPALHRNTHDTIHTHTTRICTLNYYTDRKNTTHMHTHTHMHNTLDTYIRIHIPTCITHYTITYTDYNAYTLHTYTHTHTALQYIQSRARTHVLHLCIHMHTCITTHTHYNTHVHTHVRILHYNIQTTTHNLHTYVHTTRHTHQHTQT